MTRIPLGVGIVIASMLLCGCVELRVSKLEVGHPYDGVGWQYSLPFAQFQVVAARTFDGCENGVMKIKYAVSATVTTVPDASQTYLIDYRSLSNVTKISDIKVTKFTNEMLQSVNGSAEDRSGQIIVNAITALGTIAATVATGGAPIPSPAPPAPQPGPEAQPVKPPSLPPPGPIANACSDVVKGEVLRAFDHQKALDDATKKTTAAVTAATTRLTTLTAAVQAMGGHLTAASQATLISAVDAVLNATAAQVAAADAAAKNQDILTDSQDFRIPSTGALDRDGAITALIPPPPETKWTAQAVAADFFTVALRVEPITGASIPAPSVSRKAQTGIVYREPGRGRVIICSDNKATTKELVADVVSCINHGESALIIPSSTAAIWEGPVPQFGNLLYLPYSNGAFENNLVSAAFNQDGSLANAEYQAKSSAEAATASFQSASAAAQTTAQAIAQAQIARLNLKTAAVTAQANLVTAQNSLATAVASSSPSISPASQLAQITTQNNLVSAQAAATVAQQIGLIQANTSLANAQAAYNNALAALATSQASLQSPPVAP
jgi:hypothetical protein